MRFLSVLAADLRFALRLMRQNRVFSAVGIRMALGAQRRHVLQLVAGSLTALIAIGAAAGLAGSLALSRVVSRFVQGWNPRDPVAYIAVVAVLAFTGLLACWFPARHATSIDPMAALRHD